MIDATMTRQEAREALDVVETVRHRAPSTASAVTPLWVTVSLVALLGVSTFLVMMEALSGVLLFAAVLVLMILMAVAVSMKTPKHTRAAMKQPVKPDPPYKWTDTLPFLLLYPLTIFAPKGHVFWAAGVAIVAMILVFLLLRRDVKR